jgi:membrane-bound serine protease (ClpP class)
VFRDLPTLRREWRRVLLTLLAFLCVASASGAPGIPPTQTVFVLRIEGAITPVTADDVSRGLRAAAEAGAALLVIELDTPGGLDASMRDIVKAVLAAPMPIAAYVYPGGARAASAGTYVLYAAHVSAMAPGTNLGAATPVVIGGARDAAPTGRAAPDAASPRQRADARDPHEAKRIEDAVAYIRSLAQLRGRNADWAERAVREATSASAEEALRAGVVDLIARDEADLVRHLAGRTVQLATGPVTIDLREWHVRRVEPDFRSRALRYLLSPSVAMVLMTIGMYGILFELLNPGLVLPGVVGGICLLLAAYAFGMLPVSQTGVGLIALGIAFMAAEHFAPSGALAVGGVVAFVAGGLVLANDIPELGVPIPLIVGTALAAATIAFVTARLGWRAMRRQVVSGVEGMVGRRAEVLEDFTGEGWAMIDGERWRATSATPLKRGQSVRVLAIDGLTLTVAGD